MKRPILFGLLALLAAPALLAQPAHLLVRSDADSVFVVVDGAYGAAWKMPSGASLLVAPGAHRLTFVSRHAPDVHLPMTFEPGERAEVYVPLRTIEVPTDELLRSSAYGVLAHGRNLVVLTDPASEVFVDGRAVGHGSVALDAPTGRYTIRTVHPRGGTLEQQVTVYEQPPRLGVARLYNQPVGARARALSLVPGASQFYKQQPLKGTVLAGGIAAGLGVALFAHLRADAAREEAASLQEIYPLALSEDEALRLGDLIQAERDLWEGFGRVRNAALGTVLGLYMLNVIDGFLPPKRGFRGADLSLDVAAFGSAVPNTLRLRTRF